MALYVQERRVSWGDCDPAGILYTPRVFDYCTEAIEGWYRDVAGTPWLALGREHNIGSPMVHASCDYLKAMPPGLALGVSVRIDKLGGASLTFRVEGRDAGDVIYFRAKYVACITDFGVGRATRIPAFLRQCAEDYMAGCEG
jgi:4-hydroxybenzoyl-CoA thioesterase